MTTNTDATTNKPCCGPDCCKPAQPAAPASNPSVADILREQVRAGYGKIAEAGSWSAMKDLGKGCCTPGGAVGKSGGGCCGPSSFTAEELARTLGYSESELSGVAEDANLGLSCG